MDTTGQILQVPQNAIKTVQKMDFKKSFPLILGSVVIVLLGVGTGWLLSGNSLNSQKGAVNQGTKITANEAGIVDESTFKGDTAEGILEEEGIGGEGTHHLVREGGTSKYVYLTSSVIDLESFVGKKVIVWGETLSAKKAGWLMDVAKVKVTE
ncbi:MAG: hypothetical protein ACHQUA_01720 [Microgenomates group bacterium]